MNLTRPLILSAALLLLGDSLLDDPPTLQTLPPANNSSYDRQADAFTECMRANGVPDFPGVKITNTGHLTLTLTGKTNIFSPTYRTATKTCTHHLPTEIAPPTPPTPPEPPNPPEPPDPPDLP